MESPNQFIYKHFEIADKKRLIRILIKDFPQQLNNPINGVP